MQFSLLSTLPLESGPYPNSNSDPNQVQFSLLSTLPLESGLFEACAELGVTPIGSNPDPDPDPNSNPHPHPHPHPSPSPNPNPGVTPIGYSPLALGLLSDRYDESRLPKGPRGLP